MNRLNSTARPPNAVTDSPSAQRTGGMNRLDSTGLKPGAGAGPICSSAAA